MADRRRIVTLSAGGRPVVAYDLEQADHAQAVRDTWKVTQGARRSQAASRGGRYPRPRVTGESRDAATVGWTLLVQADTADQLNDRMEAILAEIDHAGHGRLFEWRPDGATVSTFYRLAGPGSYESGYRWILYDGPRVWPVDITLPVEPLAVGLPMRVADPFDEDTIGDYTFDTGTATVQGGSLRAQSAAPVRGYHSGRGHRYTDAWVSTRHGHFATPGTDLETGVIVKRIDDANYVAAYATKTALKIVRVRNGATPVTLATTAITALTTTGYWLRARAEGDTITVEHFLAPTAALPTPAATPAAIVSHTLVGDDADTFGAGVAGDVGIHWAPGAGYVNERIYDFVVEPYSHRSVTLPDKLALPNVPGSAPAEVALRITPTGGTLPPVWALAGWARRAAEPAAGSVAPLGILEAETAGDLTGWAVNAAKPNQRGGNLLLISASGAATATASWTIDPNTLAADQFADSEVDVELWARTWLDGTVITPRLTLSARSVDGNAFGAERFTHEYGTEGKPLAQAAAGNRWAKLGTLTLPTSPTEPRLMKLWLALALGPGTSGEAGVDYLLAVPARARALGPTGVPLDATYPTFVASTAQTTKVIRSDLSGAVAKPPAAAVRDHGLGGNLIELDPGDNDLVVKLSSAVPDDTAGTVAEQLAHTAAVQVDVTPRYRLVAT